MINDYFDLGAAISSRMETKTEEPTPFRFEDMLALVQRLKTEYTVERPFFEIHPRAMYQIGIAVRKHSFVFADGTTKLKPLSRKERLRMNRRKPRKVQ